MARENKQDSPAKLTPEQEEVELRKMQEEEDAKNAALAAAKEAAVAAAAAQVVYDRNTRAKAPPPKPRYVGDIPVMCLKDNSWCNLGGRHYALKKGVELEMDPGHAVELEDTGWVARVTVVASNT